MRCQQFSKPDPTWYPPTINSRPRTPRLNTKREKNEKLTAPGDRWQTAREWSRLRRRRREMPVDCPRKRTTRSVPLRRRHRRPTAAAADDDDAGDLRGDAAAVAGCGSASCGCGLWPPGTPCRRWPSLPRTAGRRHRRWRTLCNRDPATKYGLELYFTVIYRDVFPRQLIWGHFLEAFPWSILTILRLLVKIFGDRILWSLTCIVNQFVCF